MNQKPDFQELLAARIRLAGETHESIAMKTGLDATMIETLISEKRLPRLDHFGLICQALGLSRKEYVELVLTAAGIPDELSRVR